MGIKENIIGQFKRPHGFLGRIAGAIMANRPSNIERNEWALQLLSLEPGDRLLEVGYGPGIAIEKASKKITEGLIVGVDHSEVMFEQARKRNKQVISDGRVQLYWGSIDDLPTFESKFDKICSANVVQFWNDPVVSFKKLRSMLSANGVMATTYMPRHSKATAADALAKARDIVEQLRAAGFSSIKVEEKLMKPASVICVLARNNNWQ